MAHRKVQRITAKEELEETRQWYKDQDKQKKLLIAAAPDLLDALKDLLFYDTNEQIPPQKGTREHEVYTKARAAISKAEGKYKGTKA